MRNLILVFSVIILLFTASNVYAQVLDPGLPVEHSFFRSHDGHDHIYGACVTLHLSQLPESIRALEEFRRWNLAGRPGQDQVQSETIQANIGDSKMFNTYNFQTRNYVQKSFVLRGIGELTQVWVQVDQVGPDKVSDEKVSELIESLELQTPQGSIDPDNGILVNNRTIFGNAPNVNGSGQLLVLIEKIEDPQPNFTIAGYFLPINLSLTDQNSNRADIIYINSSTVYDPNRSIRLDGALSSLAHEDQHLIHANYSGLHIFQNEGQSEWAEIANGYRPRFASNLSTPTELNRLLYNWRSNDADVVFDYSRAGLFHEYISERVGPMATGSITRSRTSGINAYNVALQGSGIQFSELLLDFHTANLVNDPNTGQSRFRYSNPARRNMRATGIKDSYQSYLVNVSNSGSVQYGGAEIKQWIGATDFSITVNSSSLVQHRLVGKRMNSSAYEIQDLPSGSTTLTGDFETVSLITVKTGFVGSSDINAGPSNYEYTASWDPLPVERETLSYSSSSAYLAELPGDPEDSSRRDIRQYAKRFTTPIGGSVNQVSFAVNGGEQSLRGSGTLRISLHNSLPAGIETDNGLPRFVPGLQLYSTTIGLHDLARGLNVVPVSGQGWDVSRNNDYWVVFEVVDHSADARVEFLIDEGSTSTSDSRYYPTRSRILIDGITPRWARWSQSNNFLVSIQVTGLYEGQLEAPVLSVLPDPEYRVMSGATLEVTVSASGVPNPVYIWTRNGELVQQSTDPILRITDAKGSDAGLYTVRAANYAGYTESFPFQVDVLPPSFNLAQNYPNPFNSSTRIEFSLANPGNVSLNVYDVTGRLVTRLTSDRVYQRGIHTVTFNAGSLASGVYMYSIDFTPSNPAQDGYRSTKKMMLVR